MGSREEHLRTIKKGEEAKKVLACFALFGGIVLGQRSNYKIQRKWATERIWLWRNKNPIRA